MGTTVIKTVHDSSPNKKRRSLNVANFEAKRFVGIEMMNLPEPMLKRIVESIPQERSILKISRTCKKLFKIAQEIFIDSILFYHGMAREELKAMIGQIKVDNETLKKVKKNNSKLSQLTKCLETLVENSKKCSNVKLAFYDNN